MAVEEAVEAQHAHSAHERPPRQAPPRPSAGRTRRLLLEVVLRLVGQLLPELSLHVEQLLRQLAVRGAGVLDAEALEGVVLDAVLDVRDVEVPVVVGVDVDALDRPGVPLVVEHDLLLVQLLVRLSGGSGVVVPPSTALVLAAPRDPPQLATHVLGRPRLRDVGVVVVHLLQLLRRKMEERDKATNDKTRHEKNQTNIKNTRINNTASKPNNNNNNSDINKNSAPRKQAMEPAKRRTHRKQRLAAPPAHGVDGPGVRGGLEVLELILPVVVEEPPLQGLPRQLDRPPDLDGVGVAAEGGKAQLEKRPRETVAFESWKCLDSCARKGF